MIKTIKIAYPVHPYCCPECGALYFRETLCACPNTKAIEKEVEENIKQN